MLRSVVGKMVHDLWRATLVWTAVAGLLAGFYLSLYPSLGAVAEMAQMLERMPPELRSMFAPEGADLSTAAGYLNIELFTFMIPLLVAAITVTAGGGATAGEEERGTMDLLLAHPIRRWRIVAEKAAGMALLAGIFCLGIWASLAITAGLADIDLALERVAAALASAWLLGLVLGGVALLAGALTGSRMLAIAMGLAVAVVGFFVNALAPLSNVLKPWQPLSPHYHYMGNDPLSHGLDPVHVLALLALALALTAIAAVAFERRDLRS